MFSTNVTGLIAMTQAILPIFKARPDGGKGDIINVGSIAGREAYAGGSIYCATKAAVRSFTDALRKELLATRVRVIEIDPGQVETVCPFPPFFLRSFSSSNETVRVSISNQISRRNSPSTGFPATVKNPPLYTRKSHVFRV